MKAAPFASLILACVLNPIVGHPCLVPICVVNEHCAPTLPSCIRFKEGTNALRWMKITDNRISGQTNKETKLNLREVLAEGSCQMTIQVLPADEAKLFRDLCDYKRSNDSLKAFNEIGKRYRVDSAEDLRQMMSDEPSAPRLAPPISIEQTTSEATSTAVAVAETRRSFNDATPSRSTVNTNILESTSPSAAKLPSTTTSVRGISSVVEVSTIPPVTARTKDMKTSTSKTMPDVRLVVDDPQEELVTATVVYEIWVGEIFEFRQIFPNHTVHLEETSPGTRVAVRGGVVLGFTIFTEQRENYGFQLVSSNVRLFIDLHPLNHAERSLAMQRINHRFITESQKPMLDLMESLHHVRRVAGEETVVILDANNTHIIWISREKLHDPLCTTTGSFEFRYPEGMDGGNVTTRFELRCGTGERFYAITKRAFAVFLIIAIPLVLTIFPLIWYLKKDCGKKCSCSELFKAFPR